MAVITELIEAGLHLREQDNLQGAIEHFRQLHSTYPGHARIMFELAGTWRAMGVPEQALPLYRELLMMPKGEGLPAKDLPRLYTQLGATLLILGETEESLTVIEEGLRSHPGYRPLRAWRIFAWHRGGAPQAALVDALELMLESLAPSRWDIFEDDIVAVVAEMGAQLEELPAGSAPGEVSEIPAQETSESTEDETITQQDSAAEAVDSEAADLPGEQNDSAPASEIPLVDVADEADEYEVQLQVRQSAPAKKKRPNRRKSGKARRIEITSEAEELNKPASDDDEPPAQAGKLKIPIEVD